MFHATRPALRALAQVVIGEDQQRHRLDHRHGARQHARIVAALGLEGHRLAAAVDGLLRLADRRRRLEGDAEDDVLAVADAALHAAGAVGHRAHAAALGGERIVVLDAGQRRAGEAAADLEALRRRQRHHGARQVGFELVEHRLAEARRHAAADALDDAAERIAGAARLVDARDHRRRGVGVRTAHDVRLDRRRA